MKIKAHITEKTTDLAKNGKYTFLVDPGLTKDQIRKQVGELFGVTVGTVRTINIRGRTKRTFRGQFRTFKPYKKAIVTIGEKDKIDLFETKKK